MSTTKKVVANPKVVATTAAAARPDSFRVDRIIHGDCVEQLEQLPAGAVDLVFADPPFNIGYEYDVYEDRLERQQYLDWSRAWMSGVHRVLKPTGSFWLAIGDEYAAELKLLAQEIGFTTRSWVVWYYTFGVNCKQKFTRSHAHLFYFVKNPKEFTFRWEEPENRIPSARQLVYGDRRANPNGRLPDDTWILRPQDLSDCFTSAEDTWYLPRVAGTFKERAGFHGCQMPEQLLGRIIKFCSHEGELVLDPFAGSASTLVVSRKLGRACLGIELSEEYVARGRERLSETRSGDPLVGAEEPTLSAPATPQMALPKLGSALDPTEVRASVRNQKKSVSEQEDVETVPTDLTTELISAFRTIHDGYSLDRVLVDPNLSLALVEECRNRGLSGTPRDWNMLLLRMRKSGRLADLLTTRRTSLTWAECDPYLAASEVAWRSLLDKGAASLDEVLADPAMAAEFDRVAEGLAPGFTALEYRWAALKLRKEAYVVRHRASRYTAAPPTVATWESLRLDALPEATAALYAVFDRGNGELAYIGATLDLARRIRLHLDSTPGDAHTILAGQGATWRYIPAGAALTDQLAVRACLTTDKTPRLQVPDLSGALLA
jgi:DNA modification methylase